MYNWIDDLEKIYDILERNGYQEAKDSLLDAQLSGGSGWEIFLLVSGKLKTIKRTFPHIYNCIANESNRLLKYGLDNNFISEV